MRSVAFDARDATIARMLDPAPMLGLGSLPPHAVALLADAWVHDLDPFAIRFAGDFGIRWYGLSYLAAFALGWLLIRRVTKVGVSSLKPEQTWDLVIALAIGAVVGGRLGYCVFYDRSLLIEFTAEVPFWGVLALNRGGMASHGGLIGVVVAAWFMARRGGHRLDHLLDLAAFGTPLGLMLGRFANFINGELVGRVAPESLPWAVKFPQDLATLPPERLAGLQPVVDQLPPRFLRMSEQAGLVPAMIEAVREGQPAAIEAVRQLVEPRHPSQIYQALLEGLAVFIVLAIWYRKPRKVLTTGALFGVAYAVLRIVGEQFRKPDAHIGFDWLGLTRGQWLSLALLAAAIGLAVWAWRRDAPRLGGWMPSSPTDPAAPKAADPAAPENPDEAPPPA